MREKYHKKWKQECKQKQSLLFNFCNIFDLSTSRTPKILWWHSVFKPDFYMWFLQLHWIFFSIRVFFHRHWWFTGQQGKGGDHLLFHFTTSTRSRTLRHLFATLRVRWLSHIFNRNACVYHNATHMYPSRQTTISAVSVNTCWSALCMLWLCKVKHYKGAFAINFFKLIWKFS